MYRLPNGKQNKEKEREEMKVEQAPDSWNGEGQPGSSKGRSGVGRERDMTWYLTGGTLAWVAAPLRYAGPRPSLSVLGTNSKAHVHGETKRRKEVGPRTLEEIARRPLPGLFTLGWVARHRAVGGLVKSSCR